MGRPSPPLQSEGKKKSKLNTSLSTNASTSTPISKAKRFKNFMGGSGGGGFGFAALNEKRISQRYNKRKRRKSMQICDSVSVDNIYTVDNTKVDNTKTCSLQRGLGNAAKKVKTSDSGIINIDYEKIQEERQSKLEELKADNMSEKELKKRKKKRKKLSRQLCQKTKRGQPLMGNHLQHLLSKIQNVTSTSSNS